MKSSNLSVENNNQVEADPTGSEAFSERLLEALNLAGIDPSPTNVARLFNRVSKRWSVTPHGVRKWILGEGFPSHGRLCILAEILGVAPEWLRFGPKIGECEPVSIGDANLLQMNVLYRQFDRRQQRRVIEMLELLVNFTAKDA